MVILDRKNPAPGREKHAKSEYIIDGTCLRGLEDEFADAIETIQRLHCQCGNGAI